MFAFLSNQERQLAAARRAIQHVAEQSDMPLSIRMWDGTTIPLGPSAEDSKLTVSIRGPGVIGALVRWPTLDHFVRQYATGGIDLSGGDLIDFGTALRSARQGAGVVE